MSAPEPSFSAVIDKLREENVRLSEEVRELRSREGVESRRRRLVEGYISRSDQDPHDLVASEDFT